MLIKCKECGNSVSDRASVCPHCGIEHPAPTIRELKRSALRRVIGILVVIVVFFAILPNGGDDDKPSEPMAARVEVDKPTPRMTEEEKQEAAARVTARLAVLEAERLERDRQRAEREKQRAESEARKERARLAKNDERNARVACIRGIDRHMEKTSIYEHKWAKGWLHDRFNAIGAHPQDNRIIMLGGNRLQVQNEYGAWVRVSYICEFDPRTRMTKVSVS